MRHAGLKSMSKVELIDIIEGLLDVIHGRIYTNEKVKRLIEGSKK
ncbi:MAG: hypothetical protein ACRENO_08290 [Thermodesulfobacteriota bacterium]